MEMMEERKRYNTEQLTKLRQTILKKEINFKILNDNNNNNLKKKVKKHARKIFVVLSPFFMKQCKLTFWRDPIFVWAS